ncbi:hypothetical protein ACFVS2_20285 [Brevibacillus sp. NPDC058079]|uniref:hypothetical protein n=1 Tax=Brevibacillus sp. NPDC058079 TaxID=3346330 RepID=UPI0036EF7D60
MKINKPGAYSNQLMIPIGTELWHYAKKENIDSIIKNGLKPTTCSQDGVEYGEHRIYLSMVNEGDICSYLKNREIIVFYYKGEFPLYRDPEYDWYYGKNNNPMLYAVTNKIISPEDIVL